MKKAISILLAAVLVMLAFAGCGKTDPKSGEGYSKDTGEGEIQTVEIKKNPTAKITLSDGSTVELELYYYTAPNTVTDFIALAKNKVYNGMVFDTVRANGILMLSQADGSVDQQYYLRNETHEAGADKALSHEKGVISMVRSSDTGHSTNQFFVCTQDVNYLDGKFTAFAKITKGFEVFENIVGGEKTSSEAGGLIDTVVNPLSIKSVSVNTYGVKFPDPVVIQNEEASK